MEKKHDVHAYMYRVWYTLDHWKNSWSSLIKKRELLAMKKRTEHRSDYESTTTYMYTYCSAFWFDDKSGLPVDKLIFLFFLTFFFFVFFCFFHINKSIALFFLGIRHIQITSILYALVNKFNRDWILIGVLGRWITTYWNHATVCRSLLTQDLAELCLSWNRTVPRLSAHPRFSSHYCLHPPGQPRCCKPGLLYSSYPLFLCPVLSWTPASLSLSPVSRQFSLSHTWTSFVSFSSVCTPSCTTRSFLLFCSSVSSNPFPWTLCQNYAWDPLYSRIRVSLALAFS